MTKKGKVIGVMSLDFSDRPLYWLKESSIDELIEFIEEKCKGESRCKFTVWFNRKGYNGGYLNINCYQDYYKGFLISINTENGKHGKCCLNDSGYRAFVEEMVNISENEYHY